VKTKSQLADFYNSVIAKPAIPKELEPLAAEARKYKTAEAFVKAQGKPLYHGTEGDFQTFQQPDKLGIYGEGTYFYTGRDNAKIYAGYNGRVIEAYARGKFATNAQLCAARDEAVEQGFKAGDAYRKAAKILREKGFIGVKDADIVTVFDAANI